MRKKNAKTHDLTKKPSPTDRILVTSRAGSAFVALCLLLASVCFLVVGVLVIVVGVFFLVFLSVFVLLRMWGAKTSVAGCRSTCG